jgi:multiple sugar transport system ATP-binding protein
VSNRPASQRDIAFVFQMFALYPHLNVRRNIAYPLVSQGLPKAQVQAKVAEAAHILGIEGLLDKPVGACPAGTGSGWRWVGRSSATPRPS